MKKFITTFQASLSSRNFYSRINNQSLKSSVGYYFALIFIAALIFSTVVSWNMLPTINSIAKNIGPTIIKYYPEDLEVSIKSGVASHNQEDPVFIPFTIPGENGFSGLESSTLPFRYALVIDTKNTFSLERFEEYETMVYLSQDSLVIADERGQVEDIVPLRSFPEDITINQKSVLSFIGDLQPVIRSLPIIVFLLVFVGMFIFYSLYFIRVILAALLIMLAYSLRGLKRNFSQSYQIALHASTLALIASSLSPLLTYVYDAHIPFLFTAITFIVAVVLMPQSIVTNSGPLLADQKK